MDRDAESSWKGVIGKSVVELRFSNGRLTWRTGSKHPLPRKSYGTTFGWARFCRRHRFFALASDPVLDRCMKKLPGLRILRQPMDEVLFVFLLSSVKSIPQIKEMKELVARKYGEPLEFDLWSFPGWERLAEVSEKE